MKNNEKKICPICGKEIVDEVPAISREDNKTEICSDCGFNQAMNAFLKYMNS